MKRNVAFRHSERQRLFSLNQSDDLDGRFRGVFYPSEFNPIKI